MSALTRDQVLRIAQLARLTLKQEEIDTMTKELSSILTYIDVLNEVDTSSVEPTAQVTGLTNTLRDDVVIPSSARSDDLLSCSPLAITDHQITAPHAHG